MRLNGLKILLIDDDHFIQNVLRFSFQQNGAHVLTASSAAQAIDSYLGMSERLDLVISDLEMPGLDGYEIARQFKQARPGLPVYLLSGNFDHQDAMQDAKPGADGYFGKPINIEKLIQHIASALTRSINPAADHPAHSAQAALDNIADWDQLFACLPQKNSQLNYLNVFIDTYGKISSDFQQLADHNDAEGIRRLCHKMRGAAGILNCQSVMRACTLLEKHIKQHQASSAELLTDLIDKLNLLLVEVNVMRQELASA